MHGMIHSGGSSGLVSTLRADRGVCLVLVGARGVVLAEAEGFAVLFRGVWGSRGVVESGSVLAR